MLTRRGFLRTIAAAVAAVRLPWRAPVPAPTALSVRIVRAYDMRTDAWPTRLDVLYGYAALRPELAGRVWDWDGEDE